MNRIRNASLIQRERLPEKRFPTTGDLLILKILLILDILLQTTENVGKHTSLPTTNVARLQSAPTGDLPERGWKPRLPGASRPGGLSYREHGIQIIRARPNHKGHCREPDLRQSVA